MRFHRDLSKSQEHCNGSLIGLSVLRHQVELPAAGGALVQLAWRFKLCAIARKTYFKVVGGQWLRPYELLD